jgi:tetratricopeptide (TPR) repeat protein
MDYCKYHPLSGATFYCAHCELYVCDKCTDDDPAHKGVTHCIHCNAALEVLGSANSIVPFWRRLQEAFKYPLNSSAISLILGTALITAIAVKLYWILTIILLLVASGAMLKYSFRCLEKTAEGEMSAPDITDAYEGGIILLFQLILLTVILSVGVGASAYLLGYTAAGIVGFLAIVCFPAMLIRFAQTGSFFEALNIVAAIGLITTIGLPYGLLMGFILIMMSSVAVLQEIINAIFPAGTYFLQSVVSNYYYIVIFHIMGYMLFQYQRELGYVARATHEDDEDTRSDVDRMLARMDVSLKEGQYENLVNLYHKAFKQFPQEKQFFDKYFDLLYFCKKSALMEDFSLTYLNFTLQQKRYDRLTIIYKQILLIAPDYIPNDPAIRFQLAGLLKQKGDLKLAVKLLNGMHKLYADYVELASAYELLTECLELMPKMETQAEKCRQLIQQIKKKQKENAEAQAQAAKETKTAKPTTKKLSNSVFELVPLDQPANTQPTETTQNPKDLPLIEFKL